MKIMYKYIVLQNCCPKFRDFSCKNGFSTSLIVQSATTSLLIDMTARSEILFSFIKLSMYDSTRCKHLKALSSCADDTGKEIVFAV